MIHYRLFKRALLQLTIILGILISSYLGYGQFSTISTLPTFTPNNGSGIVTFNIHNTNSNPIVIDTIYFEGNTTNSNIVSYLWAKNTPVNGQPTSPINADPNWTLVHSQYTTSLGSNLQQPFLTGINFIIPPNTEIGLAVGGFLGTDVNSPGSGYMRYYTIPAANPVNTFTTDGVDIILGNNISYGGTSFTSAPTNHLRGFVGSIVFHELNLPPCSGTPTVDVQTTSFNICLSIPFMLIGELVNSSNIDYQWQSSPAGANTWIDIAGATSINYNNNTGIVSDTDYRLKATCTNSSLEGYSSIIEVTANPIIDCYCIPTGSSNNNDEIRNFSLSNLDNSSAANEGVNGYSDYTTTVAPAELVAGLNYTASLTSGGGTGNHGAAIWIDWNDDGVFDASEKVTWRGNDIPSNSTVTFPEFLVPSEAGLHRLRVQYHYNKTGENLEPCTATSPYSETEDYMVNVIIPSDCSGTPIAGSITGITEVCPQIIFELNGDFYNEIGLTYQWQSSPSGQDNWTDIAGAQTYNYNSTNGIIEATDFRFILHCDFSDLSDTSNVHTITISPIVDCYCIPTGSSNNNDEIRNFSLSNLDNNSAPNEGVSGYSDYTTTVAPAELVAGLNYTASLTSGGGTGNHGAAIWIDWNDDGVFDASEKVTWRASNISANSTVTFPEFSVPFQAGLHRLRVQYHYNKTGENLEPCTATSPYSETEDYMVNVIIPSDCSGTPTAGNITGITEICADIAFELNGDFYNEVGLTYQWQSSPSGQDNWTDIIGAQSHNYSSTDGITEATDFRLILHCTISDLSDTSNTHTINISSIFDCYCIPSPPTYTTLYWIDAVNSYGAITDIENITGGFNGTGYSDFSDTHIIETNPGAEFLLKINSENGSTSGIKVWIDWNGNGIFDSDELVIDDNSGSSSSMNTYISTIEVPSNAALGLKKMRVRNYNSSSLDACNTLSYGEIEDYGVNVLNSPSNCSNPIAGTAVSSHSEVCSIDGFYISSSGHSGLQGGITYQWQQSLAGANNWTDIAGANNTSLVYSGLDEPTDFRLKAHCSFDNMEDYSNIVFVNTTLLEDCYCMPITTGSLDYFSSVNISSTLDDHQYTSSSVPANGYSDETSTPIMTFENDLIEIQTTYVGGENQVKIWVDWNQNGIFEANELMDEAFGTAAVKNLDFTIPSGINPSHYKMRIRSRYGSSSNELTPCNGYVHGVTIDYKLDVTQLDDCNNITAGTINSSHITACPEQVFMLSSTGSSLFENGLILQWQSSPSGQNNWSDIAGANNATVELTNLIDETDYRLLVQCSLNNTEDISNVITVSVTPSNECYCIPSATNSSRYINHFLTTGAVQNISNLSSGFSPNGYGDFTNLELTQEIEGVVEFESTIVGGTAGFRIWIDWNQDGEFTSDEAAYSSSEYQGTHNGSFTIPANALSGTTRMRIVSHWLSTSGDADPCITGFTYGEFEDYTVHLLPPPCTNPIVDLGGDQEVCNGNSIVLDAGNPGATYLWSDQSTGQTLTVTQPGIYSVTVTDGDCSTTEEVTITMYDLMVDLGGDQEVCSGSSIVLDAGNLGATYLWNDQSTDQTLTVTQSGTYSVTVTDGNCSATDEVTIIIHDLTVDLGGDQEICSGGSIVLDAGNPGATYLWNDQSTDQTLTVTQVGTYSVTVTDGNCSATDEVTITVNDITVDLGGDQEICSGSSIVLDAGNPGATYLWNDQSTDQTLTVTQAGTYSVTVTDGNCSATDEVTITVNDITVDLGADQEICSGSSIVLDAGNPGATYLWNDQSTDQTLTVTQAGTYSVTVTDGNCSATDEVTITLIDGASADGISITPLQGDCRYQFNVVNPHNVVHYLWEFGDGNTSTEMNPIYNYAESDHYNVSLTLTDECGNTITLTAEFNCIIGIKDIEADKMISLYPNPAKDEIRIDYDLSVQIKNIKIINILGQTVLEQFVDQQSTIQIDVSRLTSGIYHIHMETDKGAVIRKFEIIH